MPSNRSYKRRRTGGYDAKRHGPKRKSFSESYNPMHYVPRGRGGYMQVRSAKEPGYVDLANADYKLDTTGSITLLNTVPQGAGTSERIGKKILLKSLQMRGKAFAGTTCLTADGAYIIVYDKRPTGVLPAITDVLVAVNSNAMNNDVNSGRFRILKRIDFIFIGNSGTAGQSTSETAHTADFFLSLKGLPQVFKAAGTGAIGDIEEGALYLISVGDTAAGNAAATLSSRFRLRYMDV